MRLFLLAPLILLVLACAPKIDSPEPTIASGSINVPGNIAHWTPVTERAFMQGCTKSSDLATCGCMMLFAQEQWTEADLATLDLESIRYKALILEAAVRCTDD